jgi:hypothetical protein
VSAARRARQKSNRAVYGNGHEHVAGERCLVCKPLPLTEQQRLAKYARDAQDRFTRQMRPQLSSGFPSIESILAKARGPRATGASAVRRSRYTTRGYRKVAK